nr:hypothetical protein B0A51_10140 [Rachicladosporium sp. CCFEE 5018]
MATTGTANAGYASPSKHTFVVEHLDPELESWQLLEYKTIAAECAASGSRFILSGMSASHPDLPQVEQSSQHVEDLVKSAGVPHDRVCLLDPKGESDLAPADGDLFDIFVFGGILGDDPPRDRTAELRVKGFKGRRLGVEQLTTDTAARVTRIVVQDKIPLNNVPYVDRPNIEIAEGESVEMPFKYVKGRDGKPIMPEGMAALLASDADKSILDLL